MTDEVDSIAVSRVRTDDWPVQATDAIVKVVGTAHDKITGPITTVARAIAYGVLAISLGSAAVALAIIVSGRVLDAYLPDAVFGKEHMWAAHAIVGAVLTIAGVVCFRLARRAPAEEA